MTSALTVALAPGVWRIRLIRDFVNGFILRDDDGQVTLIDMGVKRSGPKVLAGLREAGLAVEDVTRLLLTHAHPDHAGGAAHVAQATGRAFAVPAADADFAASGASPPRDHSLRLGRLFDRLGGGGFDPVPVERELADGEVLPIAGGLRVIGMPGHTPGHAGYLHEPSGTLITGDAIFNVRGIRWPIKAFCTDFAMTTRTARRLVELDYETAAFTHGAELRDRPKQAIKDFLQRETGF